MADVNPKADIYDASSKMEYVPVIGIILVLVTLGAFVCTMCSDKAHTQTVLFTLAGLWATGAPLWFFLEYYWIYRKHAADGSWELFKHGQQLATAVWAGLATTLYAIGSSDLAKPPDKACKLEISIPNAAASTPVLPIYRCK